ncbi:MAG: DUF5706 domain-containing protein [Proteobacteria bacterium]|nr:DUF5706 domain-containing protein [Pseudomonadota bacterium]
MLDQVNSNCDRDVIQTLRTAHQNQTQLNLMADQKANILIGTLVLMFTVVFTRLLTLSEYNKQTIIPLAVFIVLELIPIVLTTLVLIPRNIKGLKGVPIEEIPNPLFFGFFTSFSEQEYLDFIEKNLCDNQSAQQFLIKDIYQIGLVLKRKYYLLKLAYLSAMTGFVVPVMIWITTFVLN